MAENKTIVEFNEDEIEEMNIDFEELSEEISEAISNKTGFCHMGFTFKIVVETELDESE